MDCAHSITLLSEYHDGSLVQEEHARVQSHLSICPLCEDVYNDLTDVVVAAGVLEVTQKIRYPDEELLWQRIGVGKRTIH